jgi:hypothetical protein
MSSGSAEAIPLFFGIPQVIPLCSGIVEVIPLYLGRAEVIPRFSGAVDVFLLSSVTAGAIPCLLLQIHSSSDKCVEL